MSEDRIMLEKELAELFNIRKSKLRDEKRINHEVTEAQRDIRMLTHMFSDGVPDLDISLNDYEHLMWDANAKKLMYSYKEHTQFIEAANRTTIIRVRPHLKLLVQKAIEFYSVGEQAKMY